MLEVRGHARGGQGMVTAFEILAKIFSKAGDFYVQTFPFFGVERTGAPIMAFFRASTDVILNRSNIYTPHLVVVFDETVIDLVPVFDGLRKNGVMLLNTENDITQYKQSASCIYTVPGTQISINNGLGSKSLPIVNAAMIGAIVKILGGNIELAKEIIRQNVPAKPEANAIAAQQAYDYIAISEGNPFLVNSLNSTEVEKNISIPKLKNIDTSGINPIPVWDAPMTLNKTGNWRVMKPVYMSKTPPCTGNCPAGTDVRLFVKQAAEKDFTTAFNTIYQHNPFPSTCGRICPHFCQQNCNRDSFDEKLNIGAIERFLGDQKIKKAPPTVPITKSKKIAIIGGGPAGLTAALRLRQKGYETNVFEAQPKAGGMMRVGIPEFRLPENVIDKEINHIIKQGVKIFLNKKVSLSEINNDFDAVLVSTGKHISNFMGISGENLALQGLPFLHDVKIKGLNHGIKKGDKVAVIGGGNTAIDVARTCLRFGAAATIYYRRDFKQMPAIKHEIEEARNEGVAFEMLTAPVSINRNDTNNLDISMTRMDLGELDDSSRQRSVAIKGSEFTVNCNHVVTAIGQKTDKKVFGKEVVVLQGELDINSNIPVFCCGDMAWGGTVTEAIGSGNKAAAEMDAFFEELPFDITDKLIQTVMPQQMNYNYYQHKETHRNPIVKNNGIINNFNETIGGLHEDEVVKESTRCLHCGECFNCGNCINYCPDAAIHINAQGQLIIDYDYCKGCGICNSECPCSAIEFNMETELI